MDLQGKSEGNSKFTQIGKIDAENLFISGENAETLLKAIENAGRGNGIGILRTGDPAKTTKDWQGRQEEIATLTAWLKDAAICLIGIEAIGGMGKSTLAAKLYGDDGLGFTKCYWADVTNGATFGEFGRNVLEKFGQAIPEQEQALAQALVQCLRQGQFLLIVDNLESLLTTEQQWQAEFWGDFFLSWREYGANSKILVTSRERPVEPLFDRWLDLKGLAKEDGAKLLRAKGIQGDLESFCELVDGHPLLLTIVADLLREECGDKAHLDYLRRLGLGNLRDLLTSARVRGQHRKENVGMALVLEASFQRLSPVQQQLLLAATVFRSRFNAEMVQAVAGVELAGEAVELELRGIVRRSLLGESLDGDWTRWFEFQPVVLEYGRYQAGENREAHQRAIRFYDRRANKDQKLWQSLADVQEYLEIAQHYVALGELEDAFDTVRECGNFLGLRGYYTTRIEVYAQIIEAYEQQGNPQEHLEYGASLTDVGNAYQSLGQYEKAIKVFQKRLDFALTKNDRRGQASSYGGLGNAYHSLGQYEKAIQFHQQHLEIATEIGDRMGQANSYGNLGNAYRNLGQYEKAIQFHQQSLEIKTEIGDRQGQAASYGNLGNAYQSLGQYEKAIQFHQQSLEIATEIGDRQGQAISYGNLGNAYHSLGQYEKAIKFHQQWLEIATEIGDRQGQANSYGNLGNAYQSLGQYEKAIKFHQQHLEIATEIGDRQGQANSYGNLGNAYDSLGQYEKAIQFHQQYLEIATEIGDRRGQAISYGNLGAVYQALGQYEKAIQFHQQYLEIATEIGDRQGQAISYGNLGNAYDSLGQYEKAIQFHQQSLEIATEIGDRQGQAIFYGNLGAVYQALGQYEKAIQFHQQYLEIATEIGDRQGQAISYGNLGNAYQSLGQYEKAIQFHQQSLEIATEISYIQGQAISLYNLSEIHLEKTEQFDQALKYCEQSLAIMKEIKLPYIQQCEELKQKILDAMDS